VGIRRTRHDAIEAGELVKLFDATKIPVLQKALGAYALRQKVIASNLANISTSGYRAKAVEFEDQLAAAIQTPASNSGTTNPMHIPLGNAGMASGEARVVDVAANGLDACDESSSGVNNVSLDNEMAELAKNQLRFKFSARLLSDAFRDIQKSIRGTT
jgi:flagellar basal-body rod protein FlgB